MGYEVGNIIQKENGFFRGEVVDIDYDMPNNCIYLVEFSRGGKMYCRAEDFVKAPKDELGLAKKKEELLTAIKEELDKFIDDTHDLVSLGVDIGYDKIRIGRIMKNKPNGTATICIDINGGADRNYI